MCSNNDTLHAAIVSVGYVLTFIGCINIFVLMKAHVSASILPGTVTLQPRAAWTKALLRLGVVMLCLNCAEINYPEFADIFELFEGFYRGFFLKAIFGCAYCQGLFEFP